MEELLQNAGLSKVQANCYLYLLQHGPTAPPLLARSLTITRTNAYKILETLENLGLTQKVATDKKIAYAAADPIALATLVAEQRNRAIALEQGVKAALQELRATYQRTSGTVTSEVQYGSQAIITGYEQQAATQQPIYFIKSRADIPFLGFETMDRLRTLPATIHNKPRYGITPDVLEQATAEADRQTNLQRMAIPAAAYTAPVEWSKAGDELLITVFVDDGHVIRIQDALVAEAFEQIWRLASATAAVPSE